MQTAPEIDFQEWQYRSVLDDGWPRLAGSSRVTFSEEPGDKGAQATTVKLLGKPGLRTGAYRTPNAGTLAA